jgi:dCTP deaminase
VAGDTDEEESVAFWSSQTLKGRLSELVDKPDPDAIDCNAITLAVGREIYVTPDLAEAHSRTKQLLEPEESFLVPPGQFAFVMTEESVRVPPAAMAFISMKATFKMKGLVNVSGFHVDPGWEGPLIFAIFNAGPSPVHLQRGLPLFLIWYADLDHPSEKRKTKPGSSTIPPSLINNLTGAIDSLYALDKRVKDEVEKRRKEDQKLSDRVHEVQKSQERIKVTFAVVLTLLASLFVFAFREPLFALLQPSETAVSGEQPVIPAPQTQAPPTIPPSRQ